MEVKESKIVLFGNPILRETAKPVSIFDGQLHDLIDSMKYTLSLRDDGAAIAANQVGILKRIIVIDYKDEYLEMINPVIINKEGESDDYEDCLSYPDYYGLVSRHEYVKVIYQDRNGNQNIIERIGQMARFIQHEIDHLDGVLFIDKMKKDSFIPFK